ncbi:glycosyltransferase, partial [Paraburkholderia ginsengiterrae]|uniref:glycosyltransferase n=1 Tax=Paraburkholderia ginsengiterrae TaxID=1462993 RepID=UPI003BF87059
MIVASHHEAAVLAVTLSALRRQTPGSAQIVIARDGSTDPTRQLLPALFGGVAAAGGRAGARLRV